LEILSSPTTDISDPIVSLLVFPAESGLLNSDNESSTHILLYQDPHALGEEDCGSFKGKELFLHLG